jgi:hypothetical protein
MSATYSAGSKLLPSALSQAESASICGPIAEPGNPLALLPVRSYAIDVDWHIGRVPSNVPVQRPGTDNWMLALYPSRPAATGC